MKSGIFFAIGATALWGLAFPLPLFVPQFSLLEIVLGRYLVYGLLSVAILVVSLNKARHYHYSHVLKTGLIFAMSGSVIYYCFVLLGIRLAGAPLSALFVGVLPVTIPIYGNWSRREFKFSVLIVPILLISTGLLLINISGVYLSYHTSLHSLRTMILGILSNVAALALWTWFGVANAKFLKTHPEISSEEWATIIGISTLIGTVLLGLLLLPFVPDSFYLWSSHMQPKDLAYFVCVVSILGIGVSWYATVLWNKASVRLPISLLGQLIVFETVFGLSYVFVKQMKWPTLLELSGICVALFGILLCLKNIRSSKRNTTRSRARKVREIRAET